LVTAARNKENQAVRKTRILAALVLNLLVGIALADKLPDYYPRAFSYSGMLQRLDVEQRAAVINGTFFRLAQDLKVHTLNTESATVDALRTGLPVGCRYVATPKGARVITEIWLLPEEYAERYRPSGRPAR